MDTLTLAWNNIPLLQGQPHVQTKKAALDDFVTNGLDTSEVRHLLKVLSSSKLKDRFSKDIIGSLPIELVLQIARYLDPHELIRARRVSSTWKKCLSEPEFCVGALKIHFRGIWENGYNKALRDDEQEAEKVRLANLFSVAVERRLRRKLGLWNRISFVPILPGNTDAEEEHQYSNGRVAFKNDRQISIKSLKGTNGSAERQHKLNFVHQDRIKWKQWLLSDQLLVAKVANSLVVSAWRLSIHELPPQCHRISLTNDIKYISASQDEVAMITDTNEVLMWHVGGNVRNIDTSKVDECLPGGNMKSSAFAILFHPNDPKHFFILHESKPYQKFSNSDYINRVIIQEVTSDKKQEIFFTDSHAWHLGRTLEGASLFNKGPPVVLKLDTDGLYGIFWGLKEAWGQGLSMTLNLYTRERSSPTLFLRSGLVAMNIETTDQNEFLIWRDEILLPTHALNTPETFLNERGMYVVALDNSSDHGSDRGVHCWIISEAVKSKCGGIVDIQAPSRSPLVCGDDDYVVLFGKHGYIVLDFKQEKPDSAKAE